MQLRRLGVGIFFVASLLGLVRADEADHKVRDTSLIQGPPGRSPLLLRGPRALNYMIVCRGYALWRVCARQCPEASSTALKSSAQVHFNRGGGNLAPPSLPPPPLFLFIHPFTPFCSSSFCPSFLSFDSTPTGKRCSCGLTKSGECTSSQRFKIRNPPAAPAAAPTLGPPPSPLLCSSHFPSLHGTSVSLALLANSAWSCAVLFGILRPSPLLTSSLIAPISLSSSSPIPAGRTTTPRRLTTTSRSRSAARWPRARRGTSGAGSARSCRGTSSSTRGWTSGSGSTWRAR
jgi:hypothetical protein